MFQDPRPNQQFIFASFYLILQGGKKRMMRDFGIFQRLIERFFNNNLLPTNTT